MYRFDKLVVYARTSRGLYNSHIFGRSCTAVVLVQSTASPSCDGCIPRPPQHCQVLIETTHEESDRAYWEVSWLQCHQESARSVSMQPKSQRHESLRWCRRHNLQTFYTQQHFGVHTRTLHAHCTHIARTSTQTRTLHTHAHTGSHAHTQTQKQKEREKLNKEREKLTGSACAPPRRS